MADQWARAFLDGTYAELGMPGGIISDRGSIFVSAFWKTLFTALGTTKLAATTAYNPRANGAAEAVNKQFEIALRHVVNYDQSNWASHILHIQLVYNNAKHSATGFFPNELLFGFKPNTILQLATPLQPQSSRHQLHEHEQAQAQVANLNRIRLEAQDAVAYSQFAVAKYFDRKHAPLPKYLIGEVIKSISTSPRRAKQATTFA